MAEQVYQGSLRAAAMGSGSTRVFQGSLRSSAMGAGAVRAYQAALRVTVRLFPIQLIVPITPPVALTYICACNPVCCFEMK